jgi:hypothetical protein
VPTVDLREAEQMCLKMAALAAGYDEMHFENEKF